MEDVRFIKNGILVSAIDIFQAFDGHIHRLQGDAIFAYFGRKDMEKADAIIDSLNATSFLQYYIENSLSKTFENEGYPPIEIRVGIDFGDDNDVLWTNYGIKETNEITTTSVHTDLAAKLQSKAPENNTMIGDNVVEYLDLPSEFYFEKSVDERYIMNNEFLTYKMWVFDWKKYLDRFAFLSKSEQLYPWKSPEHFRIRCFYKLPSESQFINEYRSNCGALPKGVELKFLLEVDPHVYHDKILWEVNNRGKEASAEGETEFYMDSYKDKGYCYQTTRYKGHHYMRCILKYQGRTVGQEFFGVYINENSA